MGFSFKKSSYESQYRCFWPLTLDSQTERVDVPSQILVYCVSSLIPVYTSYYHLLHDLRWMPVHAHYHFKILVLDFKAIHGLGPSYITDLISVRPKSSYNLRSNISLLLEPPRSFYAAARCLWNSLPTELRDIQSLTIFKHNLKTHLFRSSFSPSILEYKFDFI